MSLVTPVYHFMSKMADVKKVYGNKLITMTDGNNTQNMFGQLRQKQLFVPTHAGL